MPKLPRDLSGAQLIAALENLDGIEINKSKSEYFLYKFASIIYKSIKSKFLKK